MYKKAVGFLFLQDLKETDGNKHDVKLGEDFYYANGRYNYHVRCAFDTPNGEGYNYAGLYVYSQLAPLKGCFDCVHRPAGTADFQRDELCDVGHDAPPVCEGLARWPEVNIPRYAHLNGQRF